MWRNKKFLHNCQDFTILHIFHADKFEIPLHFSDFSPFAMYRNLKYLHMTDFSPHVSHVNFVTNMRYEINIENTFVKYFPNWYLLPTQTHHSFQNLCRRQKFLCHLRRVTGNFQANLTFCFLLLHLIGEKICSPQPRLARDRQSALGLSPACP